MKNDIFNRLSKIFEPDDRLFLLSVSIGPVQEFIAEARKVKDLWTGSYLLSKATFQAMIPVLKEYNSDAIIHPFLENSPFYLSWKRKTFQPSHLQFASLPNHYVAVVKENDIDVVTSEIRKEIDTFWEPRWQKVKGKLGVSNASFDFQAEDLLNVMWVATPVTLNDLRNNYKEAYQKNQIFLEERKLTRTFGSWYGTPDEKCAQCGHREIIGNSASWSTTRKTFPVIKSNERLCAVCAIKRFLEGNDIQTGAGKIRFDSTSDVSSAPFKDRLKKYVGMTEVVNFIAAINSLRQELSKGPIDINTLEGDMVYAEGLTVKALKKEYGVTVTQENSKKAIESLNILTRKIHRPSKYYCVVAMDADEMGQWMSGEKSKTFTMDGQRELTKRISEIGLDVIPEIIEEWRGAVIYSGGDDLLAMGPLRGMLQRIYDIRCSFKNDNKPFPTSSAGIVISHHQDSLRHTIECARSAVETAKEGFDRDAVVISLRLSSGTMITCGYKWTLDTGLPFISYLNDLSVWMSEKMPAGLSTSFVYDVLREIPAFYKYTTRENWKFHREMFESEIKRLLNRHIPEESAISNEVLYISHGMRILADIEDSAKYRWKKKTAYNAQTNIESFLRITAFLAREYSQMEE